MAYVPNRGDVVWLDFNPQAGHEQAGRRPALALSPLAYNRKVGLAIFCPITNQTKGYPFEVVIPDGYQVTGVILSDQIKNLDWKNRSCRRVCVLEAAIVKDVLKKLSVLLQT
ncbi:PemK family protein [Nitrosococcus halophilus Nc 4]|uniref:PemK family protein n=1 Tax=Nitrosococcus halophilus (strain Nc4) TaxID=472759 RepID=D5BUR8_NITHN|nr:endoribonuclease MazF [Nitrosococcus halophilus]ADE13468.1 PemK family protein [Nitrosococcus halophilus Nc 4]